MSNALNPRLSACPFCGSNEIFFDRHFNKAHCQKCRAQGGLEGIHGWNDRDTVAALNGVLRDFRSAGLPEGTREEFIAALDQIRLDPLKTEDEMMLELYRAVLGSVVKTISVKRFQERMAHMDDDNVTPLRVRG